MTIARLERNIASFEELVQTILESGEEGFDEAQQALVVRFLGPWYEKPDMRIQPDTKTKRPMPKTTNDGSADVRNMTPTVLEIIIPMLSGSA